MEVKVYEHDREFKRDWNTMKTRCMLLNAQKTEMCLRLFFCATVEYTCGVFRFYFIVYTFAWIFEHTVQWAGMKRSS